MQGPFSHSSAHQTHKLCCRHSQDTDRPCRSRAIFFFLGVKPHLQKSAGCRKLSGKKRGEKQQSERTKNKRVSLARTIEANPDNTYLRSNDASQAIQTSKCLSSIMTACSYPQHSTMHTMIFTYIKQKLGVRYTCCTF